jgi:hypothetical protein
MEQRVPSVKRGDWGLVDDVGVFEGRVVVVIGVTVVILVPRKDAAGDTYRGPLLPALARGDGGETRRSPEPAPAEPSNLPQRDARTRARAIRDSR